MRELKVRAAELENATATLTSTGKQLDAELSTALAAAESLAAEKQALK